MDDITREKLLRAALVTVGAIFFTIYPLSLLWPSGWQWHNGGGQYYFQMICGVYAVLGAYLIGSLLLVPITVLILMTAVIFGPVLGSVYSLVGCLAGAAITYAIGVLLGQGLVQRIAGKKWQRLEKKIAQSGIVAVAALRLLPIAPFTVVNVVSGAFKVPLRDYAFGSLLGLAPGIVVTNLFAHQLENAIRHPGPGTIVILAALVVITALGAVWFKRKFATA